MLIFTISPNEQHSALVLRLSRFRRSDLFVTAHADARDGLFGVDTPRLEEDNQTVVEFPEYDFRRAATCRDPLAVLEAYRVQIMS